MNWQNLTEQMKLDVVIDLHQQLATVTKERDELAALNARMLVEYEARMKERDKLVSALEGIASGEDSDGCITSIKYCIRTAQKALAKAGADKMGEK